MDLYVGLEETGRQEEIDRLQSELRECRRSEASLRAELDDTKTQVVALNDEIRVMEDNMSTLFNTALLEVSRKDREIGSLKLELLEVRDKLRILSERKEELEEIVRRSER